MDGLITWRIWPCRAAGGPSRWARLRASRPGCSSSYSACWLPSGIKPAATSASLHAKNTTPPARAQTFNSGTESQVGRPGGGGEEPRPGPSPFQGSSAETLPRIARLAGKSHNAAHSVSTVTPWFRWSDCMFLVFNLRIKSTFLLFYCHFSDTAFLHNISQALFEANWTETNMTAP